LSAGTLITSQQFYRHIGLPGTPTVVNVRVDVLSIAAPVPNFHLKAGTIHALAVCCVAGVVLHLAGVLT
jgi:hypothetical protein